jgi:hypothetical protein
MCTIVLGKHVQKTTPVRAVADPRFAHETMEALPLPTGSPPSHRGVHGAIGTTFSTPAAGRPSLSSRIS